MRLGAGRGVSRVAAVGVLRLLGYAARRLHGVSPYPKTGARQGKRVMKNSRNVRFEVYTIIHNVNQKRLTLKMAGL